MSYFVGNILDPEGMKVSLGSERVADHQFVAALVNAYRDGELVTPSSETGTTDVPLCGGCAQAWFTERNHLKGDHGCVVCAFLGNRDLSSIEQDAKDAARYRFLAARGCGEQGLGYSVDVELDFRGNVFAGPDAKLGEWPDAFNRAVDAAMEKVNG